MRKFLFLLCCSLCLVCTSDISASTQIDRNMDIAKEYEGNFYKFFLDGEWYVFNDFGTDLGDPINYSIPDSVSIRYYINKDDGYVIQYYETLDNIAYGVWKGGTLVSLSSSKY